jgi:hypothetical protein
MEKNCKLFMHLMIDTQKEDKCKTNRLGVLKMVHDLALRVMKRYRIRFFLGYGKTVFRPFLGKINQPLFQDFTSSAKRFGASIWFSRAKSFVPITMRIDMG